MFVYCIICSENLKRYVGQHKGENLGKYLSRKFFDAHRRYGRIQKSRLYAAMRKYPRECWSIHPILSDLKTREECDHWEKFYIFSWGTQNSEVGYNICDGGQGGHGVEMTPEVRAKIAASNAISMLGKKQSPETVAKRRAKQIGQKRTPEQVARISAGRLGKGVGDRNAQHRDGLSEEQKRKIGESNKKGWTPERRAAWSEYKRAHPTGIAVTTLGG